MEKIDRDQKIAEAISWSSTIMFVVGGFLQFTAQQHFLGALSVFCGSLTIVFRVAMHYVKMYWIIKCEAEFAMRDRLVHEEKMSGMAERHMANGGSFELQGVKSSRKKYTN